MSVVRSALPKLPWVTLALAGLMAALHAALGPAPADLVFDRAALAGGDWWRLVTGHWVHSDPGHLVWNLSGLIVLGAMLERFSRPALLGALLLGHVGVNLALATWLPGMACYCGLSGVLNAVLVAALAAAWAATRSPVVPAVAVFSLAKIGVEAWLGHALFSDTAWTSVPLVHLAGWASGAAWWLLSGTAVFNAQAARCVPN